VFATGGKRRAGTSHIFSKQISTSRRSRGKRAGVLAGKLSFLFATNCMYVDRVANHTSALKVSKALTPLPHFVEASTTPPEQVTVLGTIISCRDIRYQLCRRQRARDRSRTLRFLDVAGSLAWPLTSTLPSRQKLGSA